MTRGGMGLQIQNIFRNISLYEKGLIMQTFLYHCGIASCNDKLKEIFSVKIFGKY